MESILSLIVNAENIRMLVTLVFGFSCFVWFKSSLEKKIDRLDHKIDKVEASLNKRIDKVEVSLNKRIDEVEASLKASINELKYNDFAHLMNAFKALTYVLEKNGSLSKEDKEYVDNQLYGQPPVAAPL
ncbi:MAG: hypothetical protein FWF67_03935 [Fibromonadales bacterium]|nr:hypothetical protein [Fibromonadales bacterium]